MRKILPLILGAAAVLAVPASAAQRATPEEQLARAIGDRVAGEPVHCINLRTSQNSRVIDRTALVYEVGSTIYVNRPRSGAESLNRWDTQVVRPFGSQLCSTDTVRIVDPTTHMLTGIVFLGDFVPYSRPRR